MVFPILGSGDSSAGYNVENSLRSNQADGAYLSDAISSPNTDIFTISMWVKPSLVLTGSATFFEIGKALTGEAGDYTTFAGHFDGYTDHGGRSSFNSYDGVANAYRIRWGAPGTFKHRDPSAWYHIVMRMDSSQGTLANRARIYVNGEDISSRLTKTVDPSQNDDYFHATGSSVYFPGGVNTGGGKWNGYIAEAAYIDGTSYAASTFGETDEDSGIWKPKDFKADVTFGTNGLYLEFKQSGTGTNSSGLGADTSGNDNHMAVTNFAASDQCTDTPTNNFCTLNPYQRGNIPSYLVDLSEGNTQAVRASNDWVPYGSTMAVTSGKWYWENKWISGSGDVIFGVQAQEWADLTGLYTTDNRYPGYYSGRVGVSYHTGSNYYHNGGTTDSNVEFVSGDIIIFAMDMDNGFLYVGKNGTWNASGDPTSGGSGTGNAYSGFAAKTMMPTNVSYNTTHGVNFGNPSFAISSGNADANGYGNFEYAVPSGYYALCTKNLAKYGG